MDKDLQKFGVKMYSKTLKNGVPVFLFKRTGMPIYLRATFFSGSRFDSIPGISHFLEHMLLAGSEKFPTKNLLAEHIQKVGGDFGASANNDTLQLNVEIPEASDIDIGIEILSECLTKSIFSNEMIETERGAVISELNSKKSNPEKYIFEVQRRIALQGTSAARSTLGNLDSINKIQKDDLISYKNKYITSGRVCFIASGDITMEELVPKLESINLISEKRFVIKDKLPVIKESMVDTEYYPGVNHLQVSLSLRTDINDYKEFCALRVLSNILGGGRGSRLITSLRYEKGLVYNVSSNSYDGPDWGILRINLSCDSEKLELVKEVIFKEFTKMIDANITETELANAKSRVSKGSIRHFQTSESWVNFHEKDALFNQSSIHTTEDYLQTINDLELKDIQNVIKKYLHEENYYTAICGDYKM